MYRSHVRAIVTSVPSESAKRSRRPLGLGTRSATRSATTAVPFDRIQRFLVFAQESPQLIWRMFADSAVDLLIRNETLQYSVNRQPENVHDELAANVALDEIDEARTVW